MNHRPISFNQPMVQALQAGTKTQTRRAIKDEIFEKSGGLYIKEATDSALGFQTKILDYMKLHNPYGQPGDLLWVREDFYANGAGSIAYATDKSSPNWTKFVQKSEPKEMRITDSRFWLRIKEVDIQRLWEITDEDATAEGVEKISTDCYRDYMHPDRAFLTACTSFYSLWDSIHGPESFRTNPWLWTIKFEITDKPAAL